MTSSLLPNENMRPVVEFLTGTPGGEDLVPWHLLCREDLRVIRDWAGETLSRDSQRRTLRALRGALRSSVESAPETEAAASGLAAGLRPLQRRTVASRMFTSRAARLLLSVCREDPSPAGSRDAAMLSLMLLAGLRRGEIVSLDVSDFEQDENCLRVRSPRGFLRLVYLEGQCRSDLENWMSVRSGSAGPLFLAINAYGVFSAAGLSPSAVNLILARRCQQAGATSITPRDLRSRFLWQLQAAARSAASGFSCRFYLDNAGHRGWALPSMPEA